MKQHLSILVNETLKEELIRIYETRGDYSSFSTFVADVINMGIVEFRSDDR